MEVPSKEIAKANTLIQSVQQEHAHVEEPGPIASIASQLLSTIANMELQKQRVMTGKGREESE